MDEKGDVTEPSTPDFDWQKPGQYHRKCPLCRGQGYVASEKKTFKQLHDETIIAAANSNRKARADGK